MANETQIQASFWERLVDSLGAFFEALVGFLGRLFGSSNERLIRSLGYIRRRDGSYTVTPGSLLSQVNELEEHMKGLSDEDLKAFTPVFRERLAQGETLEDILPEAFAACREAARRTKNMRHFDVQILGGVVLHRGNIAEMVTGEGKTLVATLPAYLNALEGKGVHIVTVNDYLARRDCEWMSPIYHALGITTGFIQSDMDPIRRPQAYDCDITYGTNSEFGFDYLRDNMKPARWADPNYEPWQQQVQKALNFAIIDEVDNILVDEARQSHHLEAARRSSGLLPRDRALSQGDAVAAQHRAHTAFAPRPPDLGRVRASRKGHHGHARPGVGQLHGGRGSGRAEMNRSAPTSESLRRIVVRGQPFERGRQYGEQARRLILRSIAHYERVFEHRQKLAWVAAVERASSYEDSIGAFSPEILEEIHGIAKGAHVELGAVLALNARSELMFIPPKGGTPFSGSAGECTSFALLPEVTSKGHTVIGQNWDWLPFAADTMVLLEVHREHRPSFVSLTEAGLVAKVGCNAAGLGVCTNTLVNRVDDGRAGVPYHVVLRGLLDAETVNDAARMLTSTRRALSGNYLVAHRSGIAFNAETTSGDAAGVAISVPEEGVIAHSNHFLRPDLAREDARVAENPHSLFRLASLERALRREAPTISIEHIQSALRGHQGHPDGVCSHPDPRYPEFEQRATLASLIVDLDAGELWIAPGQPCASDYGWLNLHSIFENTTELVDAG